jgi:hypothetical protein
VRKRGNVLRILRGICRRGVAMKRGQEREEEGEVEEEREGGEGVPSLMRVSKTNLRKAEEMCWR